LVCILDFTLWTVSKKTKTLKCGWDASTVTLLCHPPKRVLKIWKSRNPKSQAAGRENCKTSTAAGQQRGAIARCGGVFACARQENTVNIEFKFTRFKIATCLVLARGSPKF
jgi:hypothetical protein